MNFNHWSPLTLFPKEILSQTRLVHVYDGEILLVTYDDEVWACGTNKSGCLGLEDDNPRFRPVSVATLRKKKIKSFVFGGTPKKQFVIAQCFTGAVYMWGKNIGAANDDLILKPTLMDPITKKVKKVACGGNHCLLLNVDGEVFSWGDNLAGQLGMGTQISTAIPTKIEGKLVGKFVAKISCGFKFSAAVLDIGEVFIWGHNDKGQVGRLCATGNDCFLAPVDVPQLKDMVIKKIKCGPSFVLAVNDVCEMYVWGSNAHGELGLGDLQTRWCPVKNEIVGRVRNIAASLSSSTSAALTDNFKVLMWGECSELNISLPEETVYESLHEVYANFSKPCIMHKSMKYQPCDGSVIESLRNAFDNKESSDLIIMAEDKEIFVHRTILKLRSDYFQTFLKGHWCSETEKCITITKSYDVIYEYLKYLYCGELKVESTLALELLALADEYDDRPLKRLCEKIIQRGITIENVASLYALALKLDGKKLMDSCFAFAENHMNEIIDSPGFDDWDEKTLKEFFRGCRKRKFFNS